MNLFLMLHLVGQFYFLSDYTFQVCLEMGHALFGLGLGLGQNHDFI